MSTNLAKTPSITVTKTEAEWKSILNEAQFKVTRLAATEPRAITMKKGGWDDHYEEGEYLCLCCNTPLYKSEHKFDCGCGWPGFWSNIKDAVYEKADKDGRRFEIRCSTCDAHLGHVFYNEGFNNPLNERHCVNGSSISFKNKEGEIKKPTYNDSVYL